MGFGFRASQRRQHGVADKALAASGVKMETVARSQAKGL
jgi:hypothetical protein